MTYTGVSFTISQVLLLWQGRIYQEMCFIITDMVMIFLSFFSLFFWWWGGVNNYYLQHSIITQGAVYV